MRFLDGLYTALLVTRTLDDAEAFLTRLRRQRLAAAPQAEGDSLQPQGHRAQAFLTLATTLDGVHARLCAGYDPLLQEMVSQARAAVKAAAAKSGRERDDELQDAERLLAGILANPIGSRNGALWFDAGWTRWQQSGMSEAVAEAFYQAARLSRDDAYAPLAARHYALALVRLGREAEALEAHCRLDETTLDAEAWLERAVLFSRVGRSEEAVSALERALATDVEAALALLADQELAPLGAARNALLDRQADRARAEALARSQGLAKVIETVKDYQASLGLPIPLAVEGTNAPVATDTLVDARAQAERLSQQAALVRQDAVGYLEREAKSLRDAAERLRRQVDQAVEKRAYWEGSLRNIEEEARVVGFSLHPYGFENPLLRRKNERARQARMFYSQCRANLDQEEEFLKSQAPAIQEEVARLTETVARLEAARAAIAAAGGS